MAACPIRCCWNCSPRTAWAPASHGPVYDGFRPCRDLGVRPRQHALSRLMPPVRSDRPAHGRASSPKLLKMCDQPRRAPSRRPIPKYGTTLRGLMAEHGVRPTTFSTTSTTSITRPCRRQRGARRRPGRAAGPQAGVHQWLGHPCRTCHGPHRRDPLVRRYFRYCALRFHSEARARTL